MKAKLTTENNNGRNYNNDKEQISSYSVIVRHKGLIESFNPSGMCTIITARCYMGRSASASTVYASVWINSPANGTRPSFHTAGTGQAGGYGYHKESAAIATALTSAGVELYGDNYRFKAPKDNASTKRAHIGGCGDGAVEAALRAIVQALGYDGDKAFIVRN
jgi:hypothetical protein